MTNLLVVIKYRVHVLNPDGIYGAVKHDPLAIKRHIPRVLTERVCQHTFTTATLQLCTSRI